MEQKPAKQESCATFRQQIPNQEELGFQTFGGRFESLRSYYVLLQRTRPSALFIIYHFYNTLANATEHLIG